MKFITRSTRAILNLALYVHRFAVLATVNSYHAKAETAASHVVEQKKYVQMAKEFELSLVEDLAVAKRTAKTVEAVANAELSRLPLKLVG